MRRLAVLCAVLLLTIGWGRGLAQDALNLPSELYVLLNQGTVERYGLGASGVTQVTADDQFVLDFRVAPDSNWLAYRTQDGLFIANMFSDDAPIQIEDERAGLPLLRGRGETIAWSPDSRVLVYTTDYGGRAYFFDNEAFLDLTTPNLYNWLWSPDGRFLAAEAEGGVWWIYQRNGNMLDLRAAIPGARGGAWLSETRFIYPPLEGGLVFLDLSSGNTQVNVRVEGDFWQPYVQADGSVVVFQGEQSAARLQRMIVVSDGNAAVNELATGSVDLTGVRWAPGGYLLTAFEGGVLALVDPISGNGFTLPMTSASAYSWGSQLPPLAAGIPLPQDATFIAPDLDGVQQVWRLPANGERARTITPAAHDISAYAVSPDGAQVAYVSNSSLWLHTINSGTDARELVMLGDSTAVHPTWGADSTTLYYRDVQDEDSGIWRVTADSDPELWLADSADAQYIEPQFAPEFEALLVSRSGELALVDPATATVTALGIAGTERRWTGAQVLAQSDGLVRIDAAASPPEANLVLPALDGVQLLDYRLLDDGTVRALIQTSQPGTVRVFDNRPDGNPPQLVADLGYLVAPRMSADGGAVIGQRTPQGILLAITLADLTPVQIDVQPPISHLRW